MTGFKQFRLLFAVLPAVVLVVALKVAARHYGLELLALDGLIPSVFAGAIFLIGFLLSHVLSDYKEAERTVSDMRVALEAIHSDVSAFLHRHPEVDSLDVGAALASLVARFEAGLGRDTQGAVAVATTAADELTVLYSQLEARGMSERYIVRLRGAQDTLRRALFRVAYIQRMQFVPSVHVMVQTLVASCLVLLLFLRTSSTLEGALIVGFVSYMFIYALFLIRHLEKPFRKGEGTVDDVSIFLLRDFAAKVSRKA